VDKSGAQPTDGDRLPASEDERVSHRAGRKIEWLYDPKRFPGWPTISADLLVYPLTSPLSGQRAPAGGVSREAAELPPLLGASPA